MNLKELQERLIIFTDSEDFVTLESFQDEFSNAVLEGFDELSKFTDNKYYSTTLFRTKKFEIRLLCWKPYQETPKHPHPENGCLMKILEGELIEKKFANKSISETIYKKGDVGYIKASESHILKNSAINCISLHIYSPSGFYDNVHL